MPGQGDVKYALAATVPAHLLALCAGSLPRPRWEAYLYYIVISLMALSLACILIAAFVEADRILRYCFIMASMASPASAVPEGAKLLDLREVARATLAECEERQKAAVAATASASRRLSAASSSNNNLTTSAGHGKPASPSEMTDMKRVAAASLRHNSSSSSNADGNTQGLSYHLLTSFVRLLYVPFQSVGRLFISSHKTAGLQQDVGICRAAQNKSPALAPPEKVRPSESTSAVKGPRRGNSQSQQQQSPPPSSSPAAVSRTLSNSSSNGKAKSKCRTPAVKTSSTSSLSSTEQQPAATSAGQTKPKISAQSSVNDELETASTTTDESSSPGDLSDGGGGPSSSHRSNSSSSNHSSSNNSNRRRSNKPSLDLGLLTSTLIAATISSSPTPCTSAEEPASRKKKTNKKIKSDDCVASNESLNNRNNITSSSKVGQVNKSKKPQQEKSEGKSLSSNNGEGRQQQPPLPEKSRLTGKLSQDGGGVRTAVSPASTPPPTLRRQEAKVKGVPKEVPVASAATMTVTTAGMDGAAEMLRRTSQQQSFGQPAYDKPPRLQQQQQQQQQQVLTQQESYSGASFISASQQLLGESYHPMLATLQASGANTNRTDLPRAIILPELKQQQRGGATPDPSPQQQQSVQQQQLGNQFGAIGCKVPVSPPPPSVVGWADSSPLLSASLMSQPPPPTNSLLSAASGLSIMQQLQAERRQREEEFRRSAAGSQWPGFGVEPDPVACPSANLTPVGFGANYYESLWDSPQSAGAAAAVPSSSRRLPASEGLWGTIGPNVWPSTVLQSAADPGYGSM
jgi:hypothetical protein